MDPQQPVNYRFLQYSDPISSNTTQSPSNPAVLTNYYNYYQQFNNSSYSTPNSTSSLSDASSSSSLSPSTSYYYQNPSSSYYYNHYGSYYDYSQYQGNYYQSYANNQYNSSTPTEYQNQQSQLFDQSTSLDNSVEKAKSAIKTSAIRNLLEELDDEEHEKENEDEQENNTHRKRRARTQFSIEQRRYLLSVFRQSSYPAKELLEQIAISMNVSVAVLQTWFKNTRSKQKKLTNRKNL